MVVYTNQSCDGDQNGNNTLAFATKVFAAHCHLGLPLSNPNLELSSTKIRSISPNRDRYLPTLAAFHLQFASLGRPPYHCALSSASLGISPLYIFLVQNWIHGEKTFDPSLT